MRPMMRWSVLLVCALLLGACGSDSSGQINAPSGAAAGSSATGQGNLPGSGTGDGTGSDATTGSLESTTTPEVEADQAATATSTGGADQGDPNVSTITIGVQPNQALFGQGVTSAPAERELEIVFSNPSNQPHNWVLVQPGKEQAVVDAVAGGTDLSQIEGVIAWSETVTSADTRIRVPALPLGSYPYISTVPGDYPQMKGALDVTTGG